MTDAQVFEEALIRVRRFVPLFRVKSKTDSRIHRLIGRLLSLFGNRSYMTAFWTTFGYTTYYPNDSHDNDYAVLFHEGRHAQQSLNLNPLIMGLFYLMPIVLGVVILMISLSWYVFAARTTPLIWLALFFLLPQPAYSRMLFEMDAYTVSLAIHYWTNGKFDNKYTDHIVKQFTGVNYYFMWPFKWDVQRRVATAMYKITSGEVLTDNYFQSIYKLVERSGRLHPMFKV